PGCEAWKCKGRLRIQKAGFSNCHCCRQSKASELDCPYYNVAAQSISYERSVDCGPLSTDIPERHASQSQKTTKVTKVTTMVSRQNVPSPDRRPLIVNECGSPYDPVAYERGNRLD
ncbi:conserved hypothetical protein, partial [Trichinella spiralis]|uniref:hypothetical protein n=1 Tax=Trichinella spiralis TaxID=6334 RepID=UPI0001EFE409